MAKPCKPFSRAAAILSSGLETPSPEKNVCVCRSILNGIAGRLVCEARNGKRRFKRVGHRVRGDGPRRPKRDSAQRWNRRGPRRVRLPAFGVFPFPDVLSRATRADALARRENPKGTRGRNRDSIFRQDGCCEGNHFVVNNRGSRAAASFGAI